MLWSAPDNETPADDARALARRYENIHLHIPQRILEWLRGEGDNDTGLFGTHQRSFA